MLQKTFDTYETLASISESSLFPIYIAGRKKLGVSITHLFSDASNNAGCRNLMYVEPNATLLRVWRNCGKKNSALMELKYNYQDTGGAKTLNST